MQKYPPVYYHEDLYRQIELIPEENYFAVGRFLSGLNPNEGSIFGFENSSSRPEQKIELLDRKISLDGISQILSPISLLYSENVSTGYGQSSWKDKNTKVWGFERYGIFIKQKGRYAETIWLSNDPVFLPKRSSEHLSTAIFSLSKLYSLILIDWDKEIICRFKTKEDVKEYLFRNLAFDSY